ncbi:MAG: hypothetical protein KUG78_10560 [Kangiellaceae bacterium]|nr:hypothetical protein [Kangiellaceae bacterium]
MFNKGRYWLDKNRGRFIWIHEGAAHPNLFTWENSYLQSGLGDSVSFSTKMPQLLNLNRPLAELMQEFEKLCKNNKEDKVENIWLPNKPTIRTQINCFGF